jgi:hypothetical protein
MARDSTGKWVQRAGATGGGRTYRGQAPVNWYAGLVLIIVLGLASIALARYQNHHHSSSSTTPPAVGTTWYAGSAYDICGTEEPPLASNASTATSSGFFTAGKGVITIAPKKAGQTGSNATFGRFVENYPKLVVTENEVQLPSETAYKNGETCPKGSPDAGKKGQVQVVYWSNALKEGVKPVTVSGDPGDLLFSANQLITVAFAPEGAKIPKPSGTVVSALLQSSLSTTTPTTAAGSTATTAPASTATTTPAVTATTAPATSTPTTAKSSTATTAPSSPTTSPKT